MKSNFKTTILTVGLSVSLVIQAFTVSAQNKQAEVPSSPSIDNYFVPVKTPSAKPNEDGFIGRWLLLEPIGRPNRGNTVFVDSYVREQLTKEYYPNQFKKLPKDGEKVKANILKEGEMPKFDGQRPPMNFKFPDPVPAKETLTWHAFDSKLFNVKLYRFATGLNKTRYGIIFHAVTVINCDQDMPNVRLAVGSNSASMWWLNDKEAVILSGDRRMVMDDCVSARLTLKKGKNILRGAVINGPGMSDFCVRFIDEKGNPVKNITITCE
ncbi:MAG: acetylxylan esterase [Bacteroidales bacterium]|nr:acetylxylan esterase [Bacteroidales bacterium]